jgi:hypothetical protein
MIIHLTQMRRARQIKSAVTGLSRFAWNASKQFMSWVVWRLYIGKLWNALGIPAVVRRCDYRSDAIGATVKVEHRDLFTVITVNGLDVYFSRLTGSIDGVGLSQASYCKGASIQESGYLDELISTPTPLVRMRKTPVNSD